jgi:hypothetical protein
MDPVSTGNLLLTATTIHTIQIWILIEHKYLKDLESVFEVKFDEMDRNDLFFNTNLLTEHNIPYTKLVQNVGDLVLFGPGVIHFGYVYVNFTVAFNFMIRTVRH